MKNWSKQSVREASRRGDYGRVVRLTRCDAGISQKQLGEACGISQSAVSRLEGRKVSSYDMSQMARVATYLQIPLWLVGLADHQAASTAVNGIEVERRNFFAGAAAVATAPALATLRTAQTRQVDSGKAATVRAATSAFRRMDGSTASRQLVEPVLAHLRFTQGIASELKGEERAKLAAAGSEAASLAAWLSWDMGDYGSARTWYSTATRAAKSSGNRLLTAYQLGSSAQFEAHAGNAAQGHSLVRSARRQLGQECPAIADAWLYTVEALAHAVSGDKGACERALVAAEEGASRLTLEGPPPWPWVFMFDGSKVAACRLACGARLNASEWVFGSQDEAGPVFASGHDKQRALHVLDLASAHLAAGRLEGAFALAGNALETGIQYRSGRIVEKVRGLRRRITSASPPRVVRDFDEKLYGVYL